MKYNLLKSNSLAKSHTPEDTHYYLTTTWMNLIMGMQRTQSEKISDAMSELGYTKDDMEMIWPCFVEAAKKVAEE